MKLLTIYLSFIFFGFTYASGGYVRHKKGDYIGMACTTALVATFCKVKKGNCACTDINALGSYVYCGYQEAQSEKDSKAFEDYLIESCDGMTRAKMEAAYENVTNYLVDSSTVHGFNKTQVINYPIYYNKKTFKYAYASNRDRWQNFDRAVAWGGGLMGFWALLVLFGGVDHWFSRFFPTFSMRIKSSVGWWSGIRLLRKYITLPALLNNKHMTRNFMQGVIPTRLETIVLCLFFCLVVISEATNIHFLPNDTIWADKRIQLSRYVGDRSAVITIFLMVPTYLFAGRNNFLLWITGWKQSTFYTYHKWLARTTIFSAFTHTIAMLMNSIWFNKIHTRKDTAWWRWGSVAMVCGGIMFFQSMAFLRTACYELFLYIHILMAVFFLCGAWIHLESFSYGQWAYAAAAFWCFDRFMRIARIASMGIKTAQATIVSDEILVLTMPHDFKLKKPTPGSFGYIHFCKSWLFFQSHPFTVLKDEDGTIKFLIRIKNGVTRRLYSRLLNEPDNSCQIKVAIEGFYGEYKPAFAYDQVIMVAGGNGIPGLYEYISDIHQKKLAGNSKTKFIKLYWVIRNWHSLDWFVDELKALQKYDFIETVIYVTKYHDGKIGSRFDTNSTTESLSEGDSKHDEKLDDNEKVNSIDTYPWLEPIVRELPHVIFKDARPNLPQLLRQDIEESGGQDNIAVMTCAHNAMCDDVRKTIAHEAGEPRGGRIELFELLQTW
ncbi:ferric reductase family protein TDEL_0B03230 [Torulaspora delbrueckii]|uniref:FAD-binding FR-type domain-containing protein n=1 Tax=Torulaspora delbrueckii TaxID=4950 RepID=G8ZPA8_TORDE|nr:hypothetical protein TDEL_0B03230 [Torulaspora delbrueckii]CCE90452.1 hypothetical protein TDEL_0B03230 [Torulaspora delbrueckii]